MNNKKKKKTRIKPRVGFHTFYLIDILQVAQRSRTFSELEKKSKIKFKESFLEYLRFLKKKKFLSWHKKPNIVKRRRPYVIYRITPKGRKFLRMLQ